MTPEFLDATRLILPWMLSAVTVTVMWLAGSGRASAWALGIAAQALWAWFAVSTQSWGLLPLTVVLTVVYWRNLSRWRREQREATA